MSIARRNTTSEQFTEGLQHLSLRIRAEVDTAVVNYLDVEEIYLNLSNEYTHKDEKTPGVLYFETSYREFSLQLISNDNDIDKYNAVGYDNPQFRDIFQIDCPRVQSEGQFWSSRRSKSDLVKQGVWINETTYPDPEHPTKFLQEKMEFGYLDGLRHGECFLIYPTFTVNSWYYFGMKISDGAVQDFMEEWIVYGLCRLPREVARLVWNYVSE